jgi:hypothetical protein
MEFSPAATSSEPTFVEIEAAAPKPIYNKK